MANDLMNGRKNDMMDRMNDWFGNARDFFDNSILANTMQSDVAETDKDYIVKIDMPGIDKDKINLTYTNGVLTVSGTRKSFKDLSAKDGSVIHQERSEGLVSRSFRLPDVDAANIHANYTNGVLTVNLPKQSSSSNGNSIKID